MLNVKLGDYLRFNGDYSVGIVFIFIYILFGNINIQGKINNHYLLCI